jgi:hypothetical protein
MKCVSCPMGETQPGTSSITFERAGTIVVFQDVPRALTDLNEAALVVGSGGSTTACGSCGHSASWSSQLWSEIVCGRLPCGHRPWP